MIKQLSWQGVLWRFVFAVLVVMGTYNPSGHSYFHWGIRHMPPFDPVRVVIGILLIIGWVVYIRATMRSLGGIGLILVSALCAAILWLIIDWGLIPRDSISAVTYAVLTIISIILTVGMVWSHVRRRLSGQADVDSVDEHD